MIASEGTMSKISSSHTAVGRRYRARYVVLIALFTLGASCEPRQLSTARWDDAGQYASEPDHGPFDSFISVRWALSWDPVQLVFGNQASRELAQRFRSTGNIDAVVDFACRNAIGSFVLYFAAIRDLYYASAPIYQDYDDLIDLIQAAPPGDTSACRFALSGSDLRPGNQFGDETDLATILFFWNDADTGACLSLTTRQSNPNGDDPRYVHNWSWTRNNTDGWDDIRCAAATGRGFW
jgi:hypothetical protein